jgi:hypothetical protein
MSRVLFPLCLIFGASGAFFRETGAFCKDGCTEIPGASLKTLAGERKEKGNDGI